MNGAETTTIAVVLGLVQVAKYAGLPNRLAPLLSVALGLMATLFISDLTILEGIIVGLSASGLFSGGKAVLGK